MFQKIFLSIVLFCAASIVVFFLLIKVIDFNEYKPKIQKTIKENTGYEILIKGDITLSLSPMGVRIFDIEVKNPYDTAGRSFATLGSFDVAVEIVPLLRKEIKIKYVTLDKLEVMIEKNKSGKYSYELVSSKPSHDKKPKNKQKVEIKETKEEPFPLVNIKKIKFLDVALFYQDLGTDTNASVKKANFNIYDISFDVSRQNRLQGLFLRGDAQVEALQYDTFNASSLSATMEMKDAMLSMDNLSYTMFDSLIQGSVNLDLSAKTPKIFLKHKMSNLNLGALSKGLWEKEVFDGRTSGDLKLSCSLGDMHEIKSTLSGFIFLEGEDIYVKNYDVPKLISNVKETKVFNFPQLILGNAIGSSNVNSMFTKAVFKTDIEYSEVHLSDIAFTTPKHRVAFKGALQLIDEDFLDLKVALLDSKGCATFEQTVVGKFTKPILKIDQKLLTVLANDKNGSIASLNVDKNCTPFYEGLLNHPKK